MRTKNSTISALLGLIEDPDIEIYNHVKSELLNCDFDVLPKLETFLIEKASTHRSIQRVEELIEELNFRNSINNFREWLISPDKELTEAISIITKCQLPNFDSAKFEKDLLALKQDLWLEISPKQTSFEVVKTFNHIFFEYYNFKTVSKEKLTPYHHYLHIIIDDREASEIGLGLIYSILAQSLNLPIYGVLYSFNKFLLAHLDHNHVFSKLNIENGNSGVLFYIDVMEKGALKDRQILEHKIREINQPLKKSFFEPAPNTAIIKNYIQQIILSYHQWHKQGHKGEQLEHFLSIMEKEGY